MHLYRGWGSVILTWETFLTDERPQDENDMLRQLERTMEKQ